MSETEAQPGRARENAPTRFLLAPGAALRLQRAGSEKRVAAEVIGYGGSGVHAFIIIGSGHGEDTGALQALDLRVDDTLLVRCLYDGTVYGFRTTVTRLLTEPEYLLFVLYPHAVEQVSVRRDPRLHCRIPCETELTGADSRTLMMDISASGCGLAGRVADADNPPAPGAPVSVTLPVPGGGPPATLSGQLCRVGVDDERWEGGVRFDAEQDAIVEQLQPYLALAERG